MRSNSLIEQCEDPGARRRALLCPGEAIGTTDGASGIGTIETNATSAARAQHADR